jgi:hypothetical protein
MPTFTDGRLNHILQSVLQETDDDGVYHQILDNFNATGISGTTTIQDVMDIPFQDIYTLKWKPPSKNSKETISKGVAMKLIAIIKYIAHANQTTNNGVMMDEADFTNLLNDTDFVTLWRYAQRHNSASLPVPPPPVSTTPTTTGTVTASNPVDQFKKGVKRDNRMRLGIQPSWKKKQTLPRWTTCLFLMLFWLHHHLMHVATIALSQTERTLPVAPRYIHR